MSENIYQKLAKVQSELNVPKSQYNHFGKYNYRNAEDILSAAKPLCIKHGLLLTISDELVNIGDRYYVKSTVEVLDVNDNIALTSTIAYAREPESKKGMDESQLTGSCSSYARKYALNGLFCLDDVKDADHSPNAKKSSNMDEKVEKLKDSGLIPEKPDIEYEIETQFEGQMTVVGSRINAIDIHGNKFHTFSKTDGKAIKESIEHGTSVKLSYKDTQYGKEIQHRKVREIVGGDS